MADPRRWMWAEACEMLERAEQLHRQFFQPSLATATPVNWEPPVDVFQNGAELSIVVALPGVETPDLEVVADRDVLIVAGVRRLPAVPRGTAILRLEIPHGRFERRIRLPSSRWEVKRSVLSNGCLELDLTRQP